MSGLYRCGLSGGTSYRITLTLQVHVWNGSDADRYASADWVYEIHDGVITKISGEMPFAQLPTKYQTAPATANITAITIEEI